MNLHERQLVMFENRIKKIEAGTTTSNRLASNKLRYGIMADYHRNILEKWKEGNPFCYADGFNNTIEAMGVTALNMERLSDPVARDSARYIDLAASHGFPADVCSRIRAGVGIVLSGDVPPPTFVVARATGCDARVPRMEFLAHHFRVPIFVMDAPFEDQSEEAVQYMVEQHWDLIHFIEDVVGTKFDEEKLREVQENRHTSRAFLREIQELRKMVPCVMSGRDTLRGGLRQVVNSNEKLYMQMMRDEIAERVANKRAAVGDEKLRVLWLVSAPLYADTFSPFEKMGVAFPMCEISMDSGAIEDIVDDEWEAQWRNDPPVVREARPGTGSGWGGVAETRVKRVLRMCRDFKIDAIVHFSHWGCRHNNTSAKIVADRAEEDLGIPTLIIEGDNTDIRNYNEREYLGQLEEFFNMCIMMKGGDVEESGGNEDVEEPEIDYVADTM